LVKFWNFFFPRGVIDYAEFKKNKISVIRQRLNGAQFRVFTLLIIYKLTFKISIKE
jgi:hypothetical protein